MVHCRHLLSCSKTEIEGCCHILCCAATKKRRPVTFFVALQQNKKKKAMTTMLSLPFSLCCNKKRRLIAFFIVLRQKKGDNNFVAVIVFATLQQKKEGYSNNVVIFFYYVATKKKKKGLREGAYLKLSLLVPRGSHLRHSETPSSWACFKRWFHSSFYSRWLCSCSRSNNGFIRTTTMALLSHQWFMNSGDGVNVYSSGR
jgi:hypothetical protein